MGPWSLRVALAPPAPAAAPQTPPADSAPGHGKRSQLEDNRQTARGGKGVKTLNITEKTGRLVAIKNVTDDNDLMIINRSGIAIRLSVAECRVMGRATQGVRLINLAKKNDVIASVCKVMSSELEASVEEDSQSSFNEKQELINSDHTAHLRPTGQPKLQKLP